MDRLCPAIEQVAERFPDLPISANTWRPKVVEAALAAGAHLINDIGGLPDDAIARLAAKHGAALVIMHTQGAPKVAHTHVTYSDVIADLLRFFEQKIALAERADLARDHILLDPGLDFAKQRADNLRVMRELPVLRRFQLPILLAPSRKTVIGDVLGVPPADRDAGTAALCVLGIVGGAGILRVHNVRALATVAGMTDAIFRSPTSASAL
jgi:dihydropteroate synthase